MGTNNDAWRDDRAYGANTIIITSEQLTAAAAWAVTGPDMAQVTLTDDDSGLLRVRQGDDGAAFAADGTEQDEDGNG
jgi:hypothetical protein